jgi:hypothetical protein
VNDLDPPGDRRVEIVDDVRDLLDDPELDRHGDVRNVRPWRMQSATSTNLGRSGSHLPSTAGNCRGITGRIER